MAKEKFLTNRQKEFCRLVCEGEHLKELREIRERKYGVTVLGQLKRLAELSQGAEEKGQYSSAINAEKIRSSLGGLTVDRRETTHQLDQLSRDEIVARLSEIRKQYPSAFIEGDYKVVGDREGRKSISDMGDNTNS
jgi:hypothetical protein